LETVDFSLSGERKELLSRVLVGLYRGVVYREQSSDLWRGLEEMQAAVRDHFGMIGLRLVVDEGDGYAYLRYPRTDEEPDGEGESIPRLIQRRGLTYSVSLMLALLRKRMTEFESSSEGTRLIVTRDEIASMMDLFMPAGSNEARAADKVDANINKVKEMGFLRGLKDSPNEYEVMSVIKAFVDADWLSDMERRLAAHRGVSEESGE
jgi:hypothetical protein